MALRFKGRPPQWVRIEADFLYQYYKLAQWDILVQWIPPDKMPNGKEDDAHYTAFQIPYKHAHVHISSRLTDTSYGRGCVAHEFLHIFWTPLEDVAFLGLQIGRRHRSIRRQDDILTTSWQNAVEGLIEIDLEARGYKRKEE